MLATARRRSYAPHPASGGGPFSLLTHTIAGSVGGGAVSTSGIDTTGATLIVIAVSDYQANGPSPPSDSNGNTWAALGYHPAGSVAAVELFACASPSVGAGHTFTAGGASHFPTVAVAAFSGGSGVLDINDGAVVASGTTIQPGNATPAHDNELLITAVSGWTASEVYSVDSGFTITDQLAYIPSNRISLAMAYLIQTTATAENPTWTSTGSSQDRAAAMGSWQ